MGRDTNRPLPRSQRTVEPEAGLLNVLKPPGMTSHDVVARVRRLLGVRRVGHTGTLDPGAAGVLVVCVGRATRLVQLLQAEDKTYRAEMYLGVMTDTQDAFGAPLAEEQRKTVTRTDLQHVLSTFIGETEQIPPMASAIRHKGRRLYELARAGVQVERRPRRIRVDAMQLIDVSPPPENEATGAFGHGTRVLFDVTCSKGTYVRTLCHDVGRALGTGAFMSFLLRTRVGNLSLETAQTLEQLEHDAVRGRLALLPPDAALAHLPYIVIDANAAKRVRHGGTIRSANVVDTGRFAAASATTTEKAPVRVYDEAGGFLALAHPLSADTTADWQPRIVFHP